MRRMKKRYTRCSGKAFKDGKELWQLIREMAGETMAKFVAANTSDSDKKDPAALKAMDFDELKALFTGTAQEAIKQDKKIYELLRKELTVYPV